MPLDKFVLILVAVIAAAGVSIWLGVVLAATLQVPSIGWTILFPIALVGYVVWRVISERWKNPEDDHYDNIEK